MNPPEPLERQSTFDEDLERAMRESREDQQQRAAEQDELEAALQLSLQESKKKERQEDAELEMGLKLSREEAQREEQRRKRQDELEIQRMLDVFNMKDDDFQNYLQRNAELEEGEDEGEEKNKASERKRFQKQYKLPSAPNGRITSVFEIPGHTAGYVKGKGGAKLKELAKDTGADIDLPFLGKDSLLGFVVITGTKIEVQETKDLIQAIVNTIPPKRVPKPSSDRGGGRRIPPSPPQLRRLNTQSGVYAHIFIDYSNIFIGAQHREGKIDPSIRTDVTKVARVLQGNLRDPIGMRVIGGSIPRATSRIWDLWREAKYTVHLCERSASGEVFLDDMLHGQAFSCILKFAKPQTLILATGDGNDNGGRTTFPEVAAAALKRGWNVIVWSWKRSLSSVYKKLEQKYKKTMSVRLLDDHAKEIVFRATLKARVYKDGKKLQPSHPITKVEPVKSKAHAIAKVEPVESEDPEDECCVCLDRKRNTAVLPCGHLCLCDICTKRGSFDVCPVCRGPVTSTIKILAV
eukprot:g76242.t1